MAKLMLLFAILSTALITFYVSAQTAKRQSVTVRRQTVKASCYNHTIGNHNNNLNRGYNYAELSNNPPQLNNYKALGGLKNGHRLRITYGKTSIVAKKGDVGGGDADGRKIDLHFNAAKALIPSINDCREFGIKEVTIVSV